MIRRLLDPERETRLGVGEHTSIRNHAWLSSLDWDSINSRALKAPFIPDSKRANFDAHQDDIMAALDVNQARRPRRPARAAAPSVPPPPPAPPPRTCRRERTRAHRPPTPALARRACAEGHAGAAPARGRSQVCAVAVAADRRPARDCGCSADDRGRRGRPGVDGRLQLQRGVLHQKGGLARHAEAPVSTTRIRIF